MNYSKYLKNTLNNNDFFKLKKSKEIDNKRIYDLDEFYQKKYNNDNNNRYLNKSNLSNRNYFFINNNNKSLEPFLSSDIEAENNIGKYRQKLLNCSNIVEENYKRFNEFQNNNRYKRLNLKYSQQNYNNKSSIFNDMSNSIKNNDYFYKPIKIGNNLNHNIMNRNFDNNLNNIRNNRLSKSYSTGNIYQNSYYLSEYEKDYKPYNVYKKAYMGKKRTDITNNELINVYDNNENGFFDYCHKKVEYLLDNKKMIEDKLKEKKMNVYNSKLQEKKEIEIKNKYFNDLNLQNMLDLKNSKIKYKSLLDEQVRDNINNRLMNENLTFGELIQNKNLLDKNGTPTPDRNFLNKNRFVDVNPYNHRKYFLGNSSLDNNVIVHPQDQFKINKYLFPKITPKN